MNVIGVRHMKELRLIALFVFMIVSLGVIAYFSPPSEAETNLYLTGTVFFKSSNSPASSLWVEVVNGGERVARSLTGDDGRYYISGLAAGSYEIIVLKSNQELFRRQLQLTGNRTFDITL